MIGILQMFVFLPLLDASLPPNAGMFMQEVTKIAEFDVLEAGDFFSFGDFFNSLLDLIPASPVNFKFETIGLDSIYFINNLGSFFLALIFEAAMFLFWLLLIALSLCV